MSGLNYLTRLLFEYVRDWILHKLVCVRKRIQGRASRHVRITSSSPRAMLVRLVTVALALCFAPAAAQLQWWQYYQGVIVFFMCVGGSARPPQTKEAFISCIKNSASYFHYAYDALMTGKLIAIYLTGTNF